MRASFAAELLKVGRRPAMWLVAVVWLVLSLVFGYLFPYLSYRGAPTGPPRVPGDHAEGADAAVRLLEVHRGGLDDGADPESP